MESDKNTGLEKVAYIKLGGNPYYHSITPRYQPMAFPSIPPHILTILHGSKRSRRARESRDILWHHLQPFLASKGYQLAWDGDNLGRTDLRIATSPFSPKAHEAFTAATAGRNGVRWGGPRMNPFLMGAYDRYQRFVVIKLIPPNNSNELGIFKALSEPDARHDVMNHTIPVLEMLFAGDCGTFVVMPSWELNITQCVPVSHTSEFVAIGIQCIQGLAYMHKQRIAHLDIYPLNILVNHVVNRPNQAFLHNFDFRLAFIDFEFSRRIRSSPQGDWIEARYLPPTYDELPEVKRGNKQIDPFAADVYALGRTLQEHVFTNFALDKERLQGSDKGNDGLYRRAPQYTRLLEGMMVEEPSQRPTIFEVLKAAEKLTLVTGSL